MAQRVLREIQIGWGQKRGKYKGEVERYRSQKERLTSKDGVLMRDEKSVNQESLRAAMMECIQRTSRSK